MATRRRQNARDLCVARIEALPATIRPHLNVILIWHAQNITFSTHEGSSPD
jgi:hypothetical protein